MKEMKVKVKGLINLSAVRKPDNVFINKTIEAFKYGKVISFCLKTNKGYFRINKAIKTLGASISKKGYKTEASCWKYTSVSSSANNMRYTIYATDTITLV